MAITKEAAKNLTGKERRAIKALEKYIDGRIKDELGESPSGVSISYKDLEKQLGGKKVKKRVLDTLKSRYEKVGWKVDTFRDRKDQYYIKFT